MSKQKFSKKRLIGLLRKRLLRYLKFRKERDKSLSKSQRHSKPSFSKNLKIENKKIRFIWLKIPLLASEQNIKMFFVVL